MIDIGANLVDPIFILDLPRVVARAQRVGVSSIFITGTSLEQSSVAISLTQQSPLLKATVGIHPTSSTTIKSNPKWFEQLLSIASSSKNVVAIGECGLDRDRTHYAPFSDQLMCFEPHFDACKILGLPMFIHSRNCADDIMPILARRRGDLVKGGVVHSFTGTKEELKSVLDLDLFVGINGCSLKTIDNVAVVKAIPLDKILIETDSPWCTCKPNMEGVASLGDRLHLTKFTDPEKEIRKYDPNKPPKEDDWVIKGRNEPRNVLNVLEVVAAIHEEDIDVVRKIVLKNTLELFGEMCLTNQ